MPTTVPCPVAQIKPTIHGGQLHQNSYHSSLVRPSVRNWPPVDSGYQSDVTLSSTDATLSAASHNSKRRPKRASRYLSGTAVDMLEQWYSLNRHHPYPSDYVVRYISRHGNISINQVKKWLANTRMRDPTRDHTSNSSPESRLPSSTGNSTNRQHPSKRSASTLGYSLPANDIDIQANCKRLRLSLSSSSPTRQASTEPIDTQPVFFTHQAHPMLRQGHDIQRVVTWVKSHFP